jgi:hypothetical protein
LAVRGFEEPLRDSRPPMPSAGLALQLRVGTAHRALLDNKEFRPPTHKQRCSKGASEFATQGTIAALWDWSMEGAV